MDRPQWKFRHGAPVYTYRWRQRMDWMVDFHYHVLDVLPEDEDNFFKATGTQLTISKDIVSSAEYLLIQRVQRANARRIAAHAEHVEEYLKLKEWRRRLRCAAADLEWSFEPYRRALRRVHDAIHK